MTDTKTEPTAASLFKTIAAPYDVADEREAVLANMRRLRAERLQRESKAVPK
jgi:hypothetical protein